MQIEQRIEGPTVDVDFTMEDGTIATASCFHSNVMVEIDDKIFYPHELMLYDPVMIKAFKIKYTRDWIKWTIRNYNKLREFDCLYILSAYFQENSHILAHVMSKNLSEEKSYEELSCYFRGFLLSPPFEIRIRPDNSYEPLLVDFSNSEVKPRLEYVNAVGRRIEFMKRKIDLFQETIWNRFNSYSFKMDSHEYDFFRTTEKEMREEHSLMLGLELEICTNLDCKEIQYIVTDVEPKQKPFFIFKSDSSITGKFDKKYELVTVPCSPKYLKREWKLFFDKVERLAKTKGKTTSDYFDTATNLSNGLHIHVSKASFGFDTKYHLRRFLTLMNQYDKSSTDFINQFARRPIKYTDNSYCTPNETYQGRTVAYRIKSCRSEKRSACHELSRNTVEVRIFQGIFDKDHVVRSIEFVDAMVNFSRFMSLQMFGRKFVKGFTDYVMKQPGYLKLKEELKPCV